VLDEILGNQTDVPITEHATDTHGTGQLRTVGPARPPALPTHPGPGHDNPVPRGIRAKVEADYPCTGPLLTRRLNTDLIAERYDDLLRMAGSLKFGHATASLLVGKLSASGRQNALAATLKEYGALRHLRRPLLTWTTKYYGLALDWMRTAVSAPITPPSAPMSGAEPSSAMVTARPISRQIEATSEPTNPAPMTRTRARPAASASCTGAASSRPHRISPNEATAL
jgi:hypothetical protein